MKTTIALALLASLIGCAGDAPPQGPQPGDDDGPVETGRRLISIGTDALETARAVAAEHGGAIDVVEMNADVAVIGFPAEYFRELSEAIHASHHRCGGFALHDTLDDALVSLNAKDLQTSPALAADYTLDDGPTVTAVMPTLDQSRILTSIEQLSAMKNRYYTSATGAGASTWLRDKWRGLTTRTDVTVELVDHGWAQKSVILKIPGTTRPNDVVVLGAHLDSIAPGGSSSTAPGADDDASGIATLTEVARALLANDYRPARTIEIIGYAAEEVGLRGSKAIATDHKNRGVNVVGVVQLDMTNYQGSDKDIWLMQDYTNAAQNGFVIQLIEAYTGATWGTDSCGYGCSDHASWHAAGFPTSMPFESRVHQYNPNIHTPNDTLEVSGHNTAHAIKFARLGVAFAIELGGGALGQAPPPPPPPSTTAFSDNFEGAVPWTFTGLWHTATSSTCASPGYASPVRALYYGRDASCTYDTGARTSGSATSPSISGLTSTAALRFKHYRKVESASGSYDVSTVAVVVGSTATTIWSQSSATASQGAWVDSGPISLAAYAGKAIQLRFSFDSKDGYANAYAGWLVDDVVVTR